MIACRVLGAPKIEPTADERIAPQSPGRIKKIPAGAIRIQIKENAFSSCAVAAVDRIIGIRRYIKKPVIVALIDPSGIDFFFLRLTL